MTMRIRSLDYARDDSGAVNSPSTSLHYLRMRILWFQNDKRMRSSRLRCTTREDDIIRNRSSRLRYATLEDDVINAVIDIIPYRRAIPKSTFLVYPF